ncbi:uncharacterized protein LOC143599444, partial [Bidens hawaiensis]|uniref:uncharacterized protein LOC143599444 n=1 Tax=Bidens hawaiensis TaxID=980011 RepID=UPI004049C5C1
VDGSESERRPRSTCKRNRHLSNTQATDQPPVDEPKRRGRSINRSAINALENLPEGSKISLTIAPGTKNFVGTSATQFATECGIVIRSVCPLKYHKWDLVPQDVKNQMYEKIQVRFNLLRENKAFMEHVDSQIHTQWKRTRGTLSDYWKSNGGYTNPELARSKTKPGYRSEEDWKDMCDY